MKKIVLIITLVCVSGIIVAQQLPQYSQFFLNKSLYNPGATGTEQFWEAQVINRLQWVGMDDAPRTHVFSANGPIKDYKMGLGGKVFADITGPTRRTGFSFSYSYKLKLTKTLKLGMGLSFGGLQYTIDGAQITLKNPGDVAISNQIQSTFVPDAGVGFHLYSDDFYVGFSVPQIIGNKVQFFDNYRETESALERHFFAYAGYKFRIGDDFVIEPAVLGKYVDPAPFAIEGTMRVIYQDFLWVGASYRMNDAVIAMAGFTVNESLVFAYSYDMTTSSIKTVTSGSHEIMIAIRFKHQDNTTRDTH
ncbi:MAG: type IX secretion system PorP/SprF family membrane protein [Salibacteraceae bacterium]|jgi:type IX secretion system PorP/SprF family membrane protein